MAQRERCKCVSCKGLTIRYSRQRFVKNITWMKERRLLSVVKAAEAIRAFDAYHRLDG